MRVSADPGVDPVAVNAVVRQALAAGRVPAALQAARAWGVSRLEPALLNRLVVQALEQWPAGNPAPDRDLLLDCAREANARVARRDPAMLDTLARVHAASGETERAGQAWRDALSLLDANPTDDAGAARSKVLRTSIEASLGRLSAVRDGVPKASPGSPDPAAR